MHFLVSLKDELYSWLTSEQITQTFKKSLFFVADADLKQKLFHY